MKIIIDKYIPYIAEVLALCADVVSLEPEEITAAAVRDADALIVRTRTQCNEALLKGSQVQFIATATIGFDHIDTNYCRSAGITWMSCAGCNAQGVCDYVQTALEALTGLSSTPTIGVIGYGHVGSKVAVMAQQKGYRVLVNDPPLEAQGLIKGVSLKQIAQEADIVTFHTPLTQTGLYPTYHLADEAFFAHLKSNAVVVNAARGEVVDEKALLTYLQNNPQAQAVIDCWEGEPYINEELLQRATIATYHIAGYTLEGKYNASEMCLNGLIAHFGLDETSAHTLRQTLQQIRVVSTSPQVGFDIHQTSQQLQLQPQRFETLRKAYVLR